MRTSLPELATTLIAVRKGHTDLAVGSIVGSNLFNLLFVFAISGTITPMDLPPGGTVDLWVMVGFCAVLAVTCFNGGRITRVEGVLLLMCYAGYIAWLAWRTLG